MWFILDKKYKTVGVLDINLPNGCPFFNDTIKEQLLNGYNTLQFDVPSNHKTASLLELEGFIVYTKGSNGYELFRIKEIDESHGDSMLKTVRCEPSATSDLIGQRIRPITFTSQSVSQVVGSLLANTGWELGVIAFNSVLDVEINDYPTALEAIHRVISQYKIEIEFKVEFSGTRVTKKVVNLYEKRGDKTNIIVENGYNLRGVKRKESSNKIFTAMIGVGENADGVKLNIASASLVPESPFVKVDDYIADTDALEQWGNSDGMHNFGVFIDQNAQTHNELYVNTLAELKKWNHPQPTYEVDVVLLEQLSGYEYSKISIGDSIMVKDITFPTPLYLNARVLEKESSVTDPDLGKVVLGEFVVLNVKPITAIQMIQNKINFKEKEWDKAQKAMDTANTAHSTATNAQGDATTALDKLTDIANDNKLTPSEKQDTKKEWDIIVIEKTTIDAQATTYGITTEKTNYGTAYNTLNTYITPLLSDLNTTSTIVGATFRTNFKTYYDAKLVLLKKVAELAKSLADSAQQTANTANSTANTALNNANTAQGTANNALTEAQNKENSVAKGNTAPTSPATNQLWIDTNFTPNRLKRWSGTSWVDLTPTSPSQVGAEASIYKQSTAPAHATGRLWLDTSVTPSIFKRSTGTAWINATPTTASEVGAYTITEVNTALNGKVSTTTYNVDQQGVLSRLGTAESDISQNAGEIALRVTKTDFENLSIGGRNLYLDSYLKRVVTNSGTNGTLSRTTSTPTNLVKMTSTGVGTYFGLHQTTADRNTSYVMGEDYTLSFEARGNVTNFDYTYMMRNSAEGTNSNFGTLTVALSDTAWTKVVMVKNAPWSTDTGYILLGSRDVGATKWFEVRNLKVELGNRASDWTPAPEEVDASISGIGNRLSLAEASITTQADEIALKVAQTDFNSLTGRVDTTESTITQQAGQIATKVEKNGVVSSINQTPESIKINASKVDIDGAVTFNSFDTATKTYLTNGNSTILNQNPAFYDWTSTMPTGYIHGVGTDPIKAISDNNTGYSAKFVVTAGANNYMYQEMPNQAFSQYLVVETTFKLESGTIDGAGFLIYHYDSGNVNQNTQKIHLKDVIASPTLNKWYTVTTVIKGISSIANFSKYRFYVMGSWTTHGTVTAKTIYFDSAKLRPATEQEVNAYETGSTVSGWKVAGKTTIDGANIETGSISFDKAQGGSLKLGEAFGDGDLQVWADSNGDGIQDVIGRIDTSGAYFPVVQSDSFSGNIVNKYTGNNIELYFDSYNGDDAANAASWTTPKKSLQAYINALPKNLNGKSITLRYRGDIASGLTVMGFFNGDLLISADTIEGTRRPYVYGFIRFDYCTGGRFLAQGMDVIFDSSINGRSIMCEGTHCSYVQFYDVKCYGRNTCSHAFSLEDCTFSINECHVYNITDRGINAFKMSRGYVSNNHGVAPVAILATEGAIVTGTGTRWSGSLVRWTNALIGAVSSGNTAWQLDVWTIDTAEGTPVTPPQPTSKTIYFNASTGDNYSAQGFWTNDEVKQGDYGYGNRTGIWYADFSALKGKTVTSATMTIYRNSGVGTSAARTLRLVSARATGRGDRSATINNSANVKTVSIAIGQTLSVDITALVNLNIAKGIDNNIGCYTTNGGTDYMSLGLTPSFAITYS